MCRRLKISFSGLFLLPNNIVINIYGVFGIKSESNRKVSLQFLYYFRLTFENADLTSLFPICKLKSSGLYNPY